MQNHSRQFNRFHQDAQKRELRERDSQLRSRTPDGIGYFFEVMGNPL